MPDEVFGSIATKEATVEKVPVNDNDIVNKKYIKTVSQDIIASVDDTFDLGSLSIRWRAVFAVLGVFGSIVIGSLIAISEIDGTLFINASTLINGSLNVTQNITADTYFGDGSLLTGIVSGTSVWTSIGSLVKFNDTGGRMTSNNNARGTPTYSWASDPDTGIYYNGGIRFSHNNNDEVIISPTQFRITNAGSENAPAIAITDLNSGFFTPTDDSLAMVAGGVEFITAIESTNDELVFNQDGDIMNIRFESDNNENILFIDGGNDKIGIGTNTPTESLTVIGNASFNSAWAATNEYLGNMNKARSAFLNEVSTDTNPNIVPTRNDNDTGIGRGGANHLTLITNGISRLHIDENGNITIGSSTNTANLTMFSPDGSTFYCGPNNVGTFECS